MRRAYKISIGLFILAFIIRSVFIYDGLFHHDVAQMTLLIESGDLFSNEFFNIRAGLLIINSFFFLIYQFFTGAESAVFVMNFSSVLFGAFAVPFFYLFAREFFGDFFNKNQFVAVTSGLLAVFCPILVAVSTYGKEHSMQVFFLAVAFYSLLVASRKNSAGLYLLSSFLFGYALMTRETSIFYIPLFIILYFFSYKELKEKIKIKNLACFFVPFAAILVFYLWFALYDRLIIVLFNLEKTSGVFSFFYPTTLVPAVKYLILSFSPLLIFAAVLGAVILVKEKRYFRFIFLVLWLGLFYYYANNNIFSPRWLSELALPFCVLGAYGIYFFHTQKADIGKYIAYIMVFAVILMMIIPVWPVLLHKHNNPNLKQFSLEFADLSEPDAEILMPPDLCVILNYYSNRSCSSNIGRESVSSIREKIGSGIPVYILYDKAEDTITHPVDYIGDFVYDDYHKAALQISDVNATLFKIVLED